jgi:signal transduction histidine kinase
VFKKDVQKISALKKIPWNSLRFKMIFFSSLMLLLTVLISVGLMNTMVSTILRDQIFFDLSAVAKSKSDQVVSTIEQDFERVALIASRTQLRRTLLEFDGVNDLQAAEERRAGMIKILHDARNSVPVLKDIAIIDLEGTVIACTTAGDIGREEMDQAWFQQGLQGKYQSRFNEENGHFTYILALPLTHPEAGNENIIGVVKVVLSLDRMMDVLTDHTGLRDTGETILASRIADQYIAMNPLRHQSGAALTVLDLRLIDAMRRATKEEDSGCLQKIDYRGVDTFTAFSHVPVEGKEWVLLVKIDVAEAFAPMRAMQKIFILVIGIIWILGSIALYGNVTRTTAPIKKLLSGTKKLGEGDLGYRIHVSSPDELGVLTSSFNSMAENLQKITASRNDLEHEVAERLRMEDELKEAKEAAEAANKAKSEFLANMSHEIRTPLNGVIGFTSLLKGTPLSSDQKQYVENANASGHTLLSIINDILDFSKIEAGMLHLEMIKIDMVELLENCFDIVKFAAGQKNIELLLYIDPAMPRFAVTDPIRLKQILANLLGNAVKFTEKGEVEMKLTYERLDDGMGKLSFFVRDTGIGITEM